MTELSEDAGLDGLRPLFGPLRKVLTIRGGARSLNENAMPFIP